VTPLRLGVLAWPVEPTAGLAAFAAKLDHWLAQAAGRADLVLLPEYACVELGPALAGGGAPDAAAELRAVLEAAPAILGAMRAAARRHGLWLLPGSLPMRQGAAAVNRAPLIAPDGRLAFQDKRMLTRFEAEVWGLAPGAGPQIFATPWGRLGVSICYDAEFPKHVRAQVEAGAWLVLVPACTDTRHGSNRVRFACQARAMENQCFVALAPTVGAAPGCASLDTNHGQALVCGPVDRGFPEDGMLASGALDAPGWVFVSLDPARIEAVRRDGAALNHRDWPRAPLPAPGLAVFA